jgi:hypothetical protein
MGALARPHSAAKADVDGAHTAAACPHASMHARVHSMHSKYWVSQKAVSRARCVRMPPGRGTAQPGQVTMYMHGQVKGTGQVPHDTPCAFDAAIGIDVPLHTTK